MSDGKNRVRAFGAAVKDYWNYPQHKEKDTQIVAQAGAPLIVDGLAIVLGCRAGMIRGNDFRIGSYHTLEYWSRHCHPGTITHNKTRWRDAIGLAVSNCRKRGNDELVPPDF